MGAGQSKKSVHEIASDQGLLVAEGGRLISWWRIRETSGQGCLVRGDLAALRLVCTASSRVATGPFFRSSLISRSAWPSCPGTGLARPGTPGSLGMVCKGQTAVAHPCYMYQDLVHIPAPIAPGLEVMYGVSRSQNHLPMTSVPMREP